MEKQEEAEVPGHVVMFPFPALGHVNPMLKLAHLLAQSGLHITFLTTLRIHPNLQPRFSRFPDICFRTIPDGLPPDYSGGLTGLSDLVRGMETVTKPLLRQMLVSGQLGPTPTCIILDGLFAFLVDPDAEPRIPVLSFRTVSACSFWTYSFIPRLIQDGQLPVQGEEDMDRIIKGVTGMENLLRCRDLPSFTRIGENTDPILEYSVSQTIASAKSHSLILNTFEDLEGPILSLIRKQCPNLYAIGPLKSPPESPPDSGDGLWVADRSCLSWLDAQPPKSVVYVSFGSVTAIGDNEFREILHGLVESGRRFLWVVRRSAAGGEGGIPAEVGERGCLVGWAPQEEVLSHEAVGGFLTHSGWNSTLESIAAGVPMICWPRFADQLTNSRFVSEVWGIGVDMKDSCDREMVAKMVNEVMEFRREELMRSVMEIGDLAKRTVQEGGSSFCDFHRLVNHIRLLTTNNTQHTTHNYPCPLPPSGTRMTLPSPPLSIILIRERFAAS